MPRLPLTAAWRARSDLVLPYVQTEVDEFDYRVLDIANDLRSGICLVRLAQTLTGDWNLRSVVSVRGDGSPPKLRVPADGAAGKMDNCTLALHLFSAHGTMRRRRVRCRHSGSSLIRDANAGVQFAGSRSGITGADLAFSHREKTLMLLWNAAYYLRLQRILQITRLRSEIALVCGRTGHALPTPGRTPSGALETMYYGNEELGLLLRWCAAVCAYYGVCVKNFTSSFADGRALCFLISFYAPELLPASAVQQETTWVTAGTHAGDDVLDSGLQPTVSRHDDEASDADRGHAMAADAVTTITEPAQARNWSATYSPGNGRLGGRVYERRQRHERQNHALVVAAARILGGIPLVLGDPDGIDIGRVPDERLIAIFVGHLCARLMSLDAGRRWVQAAQLIQVRWRAHRARLQAMGAGVATVALEPPATQPTTPSGAVSSDGAEAQAAIALQSAWRGLAARRLVASMRQSRRAQVIARIAQRARTELAAIRLQWAVRRWQARRAATGRFEAAVTIQRWIRRRQRQLHRLRVERAVRLIQRIWRGWRVRVSVAAPGSVLDGSAIARSREAIRRAQRNWRADRTLGAILAAELDRLLLLPAASSAAPADLTVDAVAARAAALEAAYNACVRIEDVTHWCRECRAAMVQRLGAVDKIADAIKMSSRSAMSVQLLSVALCILRHLADSDETVASVFAEHALDAVVDIVEFYRDKTELVQRAVQLLTHLCASGLPRRAVEDAARSREFRKMPDLVKRIRSVYALLVKKRKAYQRMELMLVTTNGHGQAATGTRNIPTAAAVFASLLHDMDALLAILR